MRSRILHIFCAAILVATIADQSADARSIAPSKPLEIRVVVLTTDQPGFDPLDEPGELRAWAAEIPGTLPFPAGQRALRYDPKRKILVLLTGIGSIRAASTVLALGLDRRFDLTHAYWLVAAVAGVNPDEASVGSAAWIGNVIDTDHSYLIDPREIPDDWPVGIIPRGRTRPYQLPVSYDEQNLFPLNVGLRNWAYQTTKGILLEDTSTLKSIRLRYNGYPNAVLPPRVITGDEASGLAFWHGALMNKHTEQWVKYWTRGNGRFVMTGMEDTGVMDALQRLTRMGKANVSRALILRTGSNYSVPPPGTDAAASLAHEAGGLSGYASSLEAAHQIGRVIVDRITENWAKLRDKIPSADASVEGAATPVTTP